MSEFPRPYLELEEKEQKKVLNPIEDWYELLTGEWEQLLHNGTYEWQEAAELMDLDPNTISTDGNLDGGKVADVLYAEAERRSHLEKPERRYVLNYTPFPEGEGSERMVVLEETEGRERSYVDRLLYVQQVLSELGFAYSLGLPPEISDSEINNWPLKTDGVFQFYVYDLKKAVFVTNEPSHSTIVIHDIFEDEIRDIAENVTRVDAQGLHKNSVITKIKWSEGGKMGESIAVWKEKIKRELLTQPDKNKAPQAEVCTVSVPRLAEELGLTRKQAENFTNELIGTPERILRPGAGGVQNVFITPNAAESLRKIVKEYHELVANYPITIIDLAAQLSAYMGHEVDTLRLRRMMIDVGTETEYAQSKTFLEKRKDRMTEALADRLKERFKKEKELWTVSMYVFLANQPEGRKITRAQCEKYIKSYGEKGKDYDIFPLAGSKGPSTNMTLELANRIQEDLNHYFENSAQFPFAIGTVVDRSFHHVALKFIITNGREGVDYKKFKNLDSGKDTYFLSPEFKDKVESNFKNE